MGCKPSKSSQVSTNNIVPSQNLQKESNASMEAKIEEVANTMPSCKNEEKEDDVIETVEVKEVHQSATNEEEGRFIAADSPDSYFSSRKEKVHFLSFEGEEVMASIECFSDIEGPKIEAVEMKRDVSVGEEGDEKKGEEEEGDQQGSNDSVDLKRILKVEEMICGDETTEEKNARGEGGGGEEEAE